MLAAGSGLNLIDEILSGSVQNGMAIVRPPGHHAMKAEFNGFCLINNVAVAARHALDKHNINRILIVDWDVHHGQATQRIFYDNPNVLYISIHRYENGRFWPCLRESNYDCIGAGKGTGYNINIPLNDIGCSDADYLFIFNTIIMPVAYEYQPELILVSAGYDAAMGCPEGQMLVTPSCYSQLTNMLMTLAQGRVAVFLEGGYFPPSLSEGAALTLGALLGDTPPQIKNKTSIKEIVKNSVLSSIYFIRHYWKCFVHFNSPPIESVNPKHQPKMEVKIEFETAEEFISSAPFPTRNYSPSNTTEENEKWTTYLESIKIGEKNYKNEFLNTVGYCFDMYMTQHFCIEGYTPERPERLSAAKQILSDFELLHRMSFIDGESLDFEDLLTVHNEEHVNRLRNLEASTEVNLNKQYQWVNVYASPESNKVALFSGGCVKRLTERLLSGLITSGVAIVRPPGHHAEKNAAGGFCLVNNVAVAARYAIDSKQVQRVMILDWDVHHGNGTQDIFLDTKDVLYVSLHRYDNGEFYPNTHSSNYTEIGVGEGRGYNINIAWNDGKMNNTDYISAFFRVVLPVAYEYRPELLIISAGFDAAVGDPLGGYSLTPEIFGHFVQLLRPTCGGKIILALEGGYNCNSVGYCLAMCCKALLGDPMSMIESIAQPSDSALASIARTISAHQKHWHSLLPYVDLYSTSSNNN